LASAHNFLGLIAARHENFAEAARQFAAVRALQPGFPDADFNHGLALFGAQRYAEAVAPLEHALSGDPSNSRIKKYVGLTYVETGRYETATEFLEQMRSNQSDDPRVLLALGKALARLTGLMISPGVRGAFQVSAGVRESHVMWGQIFAAQSQSREAEAEFRRALELDPKVPSARFFLGMHAPQHRETENARQEFAAELATHPADSRAKYHLAFVMMALQQTDPAIALLRKWSPSNPVTLRPTYSLGKALLQQGNTRESIEHLETATRLDPSKTYSHYQLARAYQRAGRARSRKRFKLTHELETKQNSGLPTPEDLP